jgi:predicted Fe-Mo cluster-binding NifX family protein
LKKRIVIPTENQAGIESKTAQHFGRAPYFTVIELDEKTEPTNISSHPNTGEHMGGTGHPHENLLALKPDVIIAYAMGIGGLQSFQNAGVLVLKAEGNTVKEIVANFSQGKLKALTGGCPHAHEHHHMH